MSSEFEDYVYVLLCPWTDSCVIVVQNIDKIPLVKCPVLVIHVSIPCYRIESSTSYYTLS